MMIRKLLLASLLTIAGFAGLIAQNQVHVYGTVTGPNGGSPDSVNITVTVFWADSTFCQDAVYTVNGGYSVTMPCTPADPNVLGYVQIDMLDCNNTVQTQFYNTSSGLEFEVNFEYCINTPPDSCLVYILEESNPGALNYLYAWIPPGQTATFQWNTGETTQEIYPVTPGQYCVTATLSPSGCSASDCYIFQADTFFCFAYIISTPENDSLTTLTAVGTGVAPFTYLWSTGSTSPTINVFDGTYCVTVVDATGCEYTPCIIVQDNDFCEVYINGSPNGGITASAFGNPPINFLWNTGETTATIYPVNEGVYCVTTSDASGCEASSCYKFWVPQDSCVAWIQAYLPDSSTFVLEAYYSGAGNNWSYLWSTGETTSLIYPADPFASYCVTIDDNFGCVASACYDASNFCYTWIDLNYLDTTTAILIAQNDPIYNLPGAPPITYQWSTGETTAGITTDSSGEYCVTVTLGGDCVSEACTTVDFENLGNDCSAWVFQYPDSSNLWYAEAYAWGWGTFSYLWSTGDTSNIIQIGPGEFACVTVTSNLGCETVACTDTFYNPCIPVITSVISNDSFAIITASSWNDPNSAFTYVWSDGQVGQTITVYASGYYCVTVTGGGCIGSTCIDIFLWTNCGVSVQTSYSDTIPGTMFTALPWGVSPFTYLWDDGETTQSIVIDFGQLEHCVTVTDAVGCVSSGCSYTFDSCYAYIYLDYTPDPTLYVGANDWIVSTVWNTGNAGDTNSWLVINQPGTYCAQITTWSGCTTTTCYNVDALDPAQGSDVITGLVFADTLVSIRGTVRAYSIINNSGEPFEEVGSSPIEPSGFYKITGLPPGVYLVKAEMEPGTIGFLDFIPTYHAESSSWETANTHVLPNQLTVTTDIKMIRKVGHNGSGVIGGVVTDPLHIIANDEESRNLVGVPFVEVLLNDVYGVPMDYVITDQEGNFRFENLPFGTYRLKYDIPGLSSPDVWVTLTPEDPEKLQVTLIAENGTVDVSEPKAQLIHLYPNPTRAAVSMVVPGDQVEFDIQVVDMQGRIVYAGSARNYNGILNLDVSQYSSGLFHINLLNESRRYHGRFVKQD